MDLNMDRFWLKNLNIIFSFLNIFTKKLCTGYCIYHCCALDVAQAPVAEVQLRHPLAFPRVERAHATLARALIDAYI
jgi:hypothetical protein